VAGVAAADLVDDYLSGLPGETRRLARAEWGVTLAPEAAGGEPLDIGLRIADGLLRAQAFVTGGRDALDPRLFLHWNRQTRLVRFGCARNGDVWVHGDLPLEAVDERLVDRLLGLVVEGAIVGRRYAGGAHPTTASPGG
jgi:putative sensory transduction regulator